MEKVPMYAMLLNALGPLTDNPAPLKLVQLPDPTPNPGEILIRVSTCGVCHTELDEIEGRTPPPHLPIIPGHQVVGKVETLGQGVTEFNIGDRVGIAWIYSTCDRCYYCKRGEENLCAQFRATGRDAHGGYSEYMVVSASYAYAIPKVFTDTEAAPLLCAGAVGYRSLRLTGITDGKNLGLTGFGASAHLVLQLVKYQFPSTKVYVFARSESEQNFALKLGAVWAGGMLDQTPEKLHAVIDTTPAWTPIIGALDNLKPGGRLVINAIRKEDADKDMLLKLEYSSHLWLEKEIKSVANVTRSDVCEFLDIAAKADIRPEVEEYALKDANRALLDLKEKRIRGAKVLCVV